jgi:hypothetical protein
MSNTTGTAVELAGARKRGACYVRQPLESNGCGGF